MNPPKLPIIKIESRETEDAEDRIPRWAVKLTIESNGKIVTDECRVTAAWLHGMHLIQNAIDRLRRQHELDGVMMSVVDRTGVASGTIYVADVHRAVECYDQLELVRWSMSGIRKTGVTMTVASIGDKHWFYYEDANIPPGESIKPGDRIYLRGCAPRTENW